LNTFLSDSHSNTLSNEVSQFDNSRQTAKTLTLLSSNQNILPSDQTLRQYDNLKGNQLNFNLNGVLNTTIVLDNQGLESKYYTLKSGNVNSDLFYKLSSNFTTLQTAYAPIFDSNNILFNSQDYDGSN